MAYSVQELHLEGNSAIPVFNVEAGEVLLQVLLDQIVGRLFGLAEPSDDERKGVSQRLLLLSAFLGTSLADVEQSKSRVQGYTGPKRLHHTPGVHKN